MNEEEKIEKEDLMEQHVTDESEAPKAESQIPVEAGAEQDPASDAVPLTNQNNHVKPTTTQEPQTSNLKPETADMEVHHHTHASHHKKNMERLRLGIFNAFPGSVLRLFSRILFRAQN